MTQADPGPLLRLLRCPSQGPLLLTVVVVAPSVPVPQVDLGPLVCLLCLLRCPFQGPLSTVVVAPSPCPLRPLPQPLLRQLLCPPLLCMLCLPPLLPRPPSLGVVVEVVRFVLPHHPLLTQSVVALSSKAVYRHSLLPLPPVQQRAPLARPPALSLQVLLLQQGSAACCQRPQPLLRPLAGRQKTHTLCC